MQGFESFQQTWGCDLSWTLPAHVPHARGTDLGLTELQLGVQDGEQLFHLMCVTKHAGTRVTKHAEHQRKLAASPRAILHEFAQLCTPLGGQPASPNLCNI